jgi:hypothetical protein
VQLVRDRRQQRTVAIWVGVFVALLTLAEFQLHAEWGQVGLAILANVAFGFAVGRVWHSNPHVVYVLLGLATGVAHWLLIVVVELTKFENAAAYPFGNWFVRFALGGALAFTGGAIIGDLAARKKVTVTMAVVAAALGIAGSILSFIKG